MRDEVDEMSAASAGSPFLLGFVLALSGLCGYLLNRIAVVSHRVGMVIMVQQSQDARLDALEKK
jgi:hypothetical protein